MGVIAHLSAARAVTPALLPAPALSLNSLVARCAGAGSMRMTALASVLALLLGVGLHAPPAQAQSGQTFVSAANGLDTNTCSAIDPCRSMTIALSKTVKGGQITCLDSGIFDEGLLIGKSVTIDCTGQTAIILGSRIGSADPGAVVILRGLTFDGLGAAGFSGITVEAASQVVIDNCHFRGFANTFFEISTGILLAPSGSSRFAVLRSSIINNGNPFGPFGGGIIIKPTGSGSARVAIERVNVVNNVFGIVADGSTSTGGIAVRIADSMASGNSQDGILATTPAGGAPIGVSIKNTKSFSNTIGIRATGPGVTVRADKATVMHNATGLAVNNGAALLSFGNNNVEANGANGAFSGPVALK